jgi:hypothetical protein
MSATAKNVAKITNVANIHKTHKAHEILVTLDDDKVVLHAPGNLELGDTAHFYTNTVGGFVEIYFDVNGSPFRNQNGSLKTEIDSNDPPLELRARGTFTARCYIMVGTFIYHYQTGGGGDMIVK